MDENLAMPIISVIVPVYKVERYLAQCLDSIVCQTYSRLQIILVDDGSPDLSGEICERYARHDQRVQVIHQKNQGLSAARNAGLEIAVGEYIAFVDSDDWIEQDMLETLYSVVQQHSADLACCALKAEIENGSEVVFPDVDESGAPVVLDPAAAIQELLQDRRIKNFSWLYLYRRALFRDVRFPHGKRYEDVYTTYRVLLQAKSVAYIPRKKYHYRIRDGSITQVNDLGLLISRYEAMHFRATELAPLFPRLAADLAAKQFNLITQVWQAACNADHKLLAHAKPALNDMARFTAENARLIVAGRSRGRADRMLVWACSHAQPWAYRFAQLIQAVLARYYRRTRNVATSGAVS